MSRDVRDKIRDKADAILKTISIIQKVLNFKKHSPIVLLTSKTLYFHQYSADFTYFVPLAREWFSLSWLTFCENGPMFIDNRLGNGYHWELCRKLYTLRI